MKASIRPLALLPLIAGGMFIGACGGDEETPGASAPNSASERSQASFTPNTRNEKRAYRAAHGLFRALAAARRGGEDATSGGQAMCRLMGEQARRDMIRAAESASPPGAKHSCATAVRTMLERSKRNGSRAPSGREKVVGIEISGNTAAVEVEAPDGKTSHLSLVKRDGQWRLAAAG